MAHGFVLVTGFGPFHSVAVNPSGEAVKLLAGLNIDGFQIEAHQIPVDYRYVAEFIPNMYYTIQPKLCIHFGVGTAGGLALETLAHNHGYGETHKDVSEYCPNDACAVSPYADLEAPHQICTLMDPHKLKGTLAQKGWNLVEVSANAGRYLCEFIFYTSLYWSFKTASNDAKPVPVLFVHVPPVGSPYSQDEINACVRDVVQSSIHQELLFKNTQNH